MAPRVHCPLDVTTGANSGQGEWHGPNCKNISIEQFPHFYYLFNNHNERMLVIVSIVETISDKKLTIFSTQWLRQDKMRTSRKLHRKN